MYKKREYNLLIISYKSIGLISFKPSLTKSQNYEHNKKLASATFRNLIFW